MDKATKISNALQACGLVNNPKVCIKDLGSTFACVCPECAKKLIEVAEEYFAKQ